MNSEEPIVRSVPCLDLNVLRRLVLLKKPNQDLAPSEALPHSYQLSLHMIDLLKSMDRRISLLEDENASLKLKNSQNVLKNEPQTEKVVIDIKEEPEEIEEVVDKIEPKKILKKDKPIPKLKRSMTMIALKNKDLITKSKPLTKEQLDIIILNKKLKETEGSNKGTLALRRSSSISSINDKQLVVGSRAQVGTWKIEDQCGKCIETKSNNFKKKQSDDRKKKLTTSSSCRVLVSSERAEQIKQFNQELDEVRQGNKLVDDTRDLKRRNDLKKVLDDANDKKAGVVVHLNL
jgi:hypothetical protein